MAWTINAVRIFVQEAPESALQVISRHNVLGGGTIHQVFGYEDKTINLSAIVVGETDKNALLSLVDDGTTVSLVTPWTTETVYVSNVKTSARITNCQNIRPDLSETATVYDVELELLVP